ncbi:hypothetical protein ACXN5S_05985 [Pseudoroseicyclus sp. H15]
MNLKQSICALALTGALAACSSGSDSDDGGASYSSYEVRGTELVDTWEDTPAVAPEDLPYAGGASYEGVLYGDITRNGSPVATMAGGLNLDVDFTSNIHAVTGTVTNVVDSGDLGLAGDLDISGSFIARNADRGENESFGATITGDLTSTKLGDVSVAGTLGGDFHGNNLGAVMGDTEATLSHASGFYELDGGFVAEKTD